MTRPTHHVGQLVDLRPLTYEDIVQELLVMPDLAPMAQTVLSDLWRDKSGAEIAAMLTAKQLDTLTRHLRDREDADA